MGSCQYIHHPLRIDLSVLLGNEVTEAAAFVIVDGHEDYVIELLVLVIIGEVLIVIHAELLEGVLHQAKGVALGVTHSQVDRTGAASVVQLLQR